MTASKKKTVRTRRGVEPTGRPARREAERGRRARTNSSRTFFDHRGRDDEGLGVIFFPALLFGDARIGSHGVAEHGIEVNCFEPSGQLGRRLDVLLPEDRVGMRSKSSRDLRVNQTAP